MTKWLLIMVTALGVAACDNKAPDKTADSSTATTVEQKADSQKVLDDALAMAPACEKGMVTVTTADGKEHTIAVEIAKTQEQQAYGLMFRKSVPQNTGMLFVWDTPNPVEFWMRNTLVSLDMLFIGPDHKIISIKKNATPR